MDGYRGKERRSPLSEEQMEAIAERAATKALEKIYATAGKTLLEKLAWATGIIVVSLFIWLAKAGKLAF